MDTFKHFAGKAEIKIKNHPGSRKAISLRKDLPRQLNNTKISGKLQNKHTWEHFTRLKLSSHDWLICIPA